MMHDVSQYEEYCFTKQYRAWLSVVSANDATCPAFDKEAFQNFSLTQNYFVPRRQYFREDK